jgi:outer membrane protein assembly factor BamB
MVRKLTISIACVALLAASASAQQVMYGSTDDGLFGIVDQTTGEFTVLGNPANGIGKGVLSGITFDSTGRVFGTVPNSDGTLLILINPATGDRIDVIGDIEDENQVVLRITDLATQPVTDVLFGVSSSDNLYTINKTTAVATFIGSVINHGGLGFTPDGKLYLATVDRELAQIDPTDGSTIGDVIDNLSVCIDGLGFRPSDGAAFATECDGSDIFRLDLETGDLAELEPNSEDTTDVAFPLRSGATAPALSPLALGILAAAVAGLGIRRLRS